MPTSSSSGMSEMLRRTLGEAIRIETVLAGGLWRIHADPNQLENALLNLAVNARDAMPEGGKLTIETANTHLDDRYATEHSGVPAGPVRDARGHRHGRRNDRRGVPRRRSIRSSPPRKAESGRAWA